MQACQVTLHYRPRDNRRRDADNLVPTLKALCDGLVDAGLVPDDTPNYMHKHKPEVGGYYVVYEDGYKSFSPAGAFESGYTLL